MTNKISLFSYFDLLIKMNFVTVSTLMLLFILKEANCLHKRCVQCRSRGELGSCGDPFPYNMTEPDAVIGIHMVACPSGWCGKLLQGSTGAYRTDDYGTATERMCLQRPPSDYEERCAYTMWNHKKVYLCFCNGDLCNSGYSFKPFPIIVFCSAFIAIYYYLS